MLPSPKAFLAARRAMAIRVKVRFLAGRNGQVEPSYRLPKSRLL